MGRGQGGQIEGRSMVEVSCCACCFGLRVLTTRFGVANVEDEDVVALEPRLRLLNKIFGME